jgi:hypothetical protein
MWKKLTKHLREKNINFNYFDKTSIQDIYRYEELGTILYIHYTQKDGITAYMFFTQNAIYHKARQYSVVEQGDTLNYKNIFKNFTLEIFKEVNKTYRMPILVDEKNSVDMMNVFNVWLNNPEKYGLKNYFVFEKNVVKSQRL